MTQEAKKKCRQNYDYDTNKDGNIDIACVDELIELQKIIMNLAININSYQNQIDSQTKDNLAWGIANTEFAIEKIKIKYGISDSLINEKISLILEDIEERNV